MTNEELARLVKDGNTDAMLTLWNQVKRFAFKTAQRYVGLCEIDDLEQAGFVAMVLAAETFNEESSFLTWFNYYLLREFPRAGGLPYNNRGEIKDPLQYAVSMETPLGEDGSDTIGDLLPDPRDMISEADRKIFLDQLREALKKALDGLPAEQRLAIDGVYFRLKTRKELAIETGSTEATVQKNIQKGLYNLRIRNKALEQYIDLRTDFYRDVAETVIWRDELRERLK